MCAAPQQIEKHAEHSSEIISNLVPPATTRMTTPQPSYNDLVSSALHSIMAVLNNASEADLQVIFVACNNCVDRL
jgi:hypothetical protein